MGKEVIAYVQRLRSQGYSNAAIRQNLLASGYSSFDAESALRANAPTAKPRKKINWVPILAGSGAGLAILVVLVILLIPKGPAFTLKTTPVGVEVVQGNSISFSNNFEFNRDIKEDEFELVHKLVSPATGNLLVSIDESVDVSSRTQSSFSIPDDLQPGRYVIRTTATAGKREAEASFLFKVLPKPTLDTTPVQIDLDGTEPDVDIPVQITCNDFDQCTDDIVLDGECVFQQLPVCCGDFVCDFEAGETTATCSRDCAQQPTAKTSTEIIKEAEEAAETDPDKAELLCGTLAQTTDSDQCYDSVARKALRSSTCKKITSQSIEDSCLLFFAINQDQFDVCTDINDPNLQSSCYSFKNLYEIQQTIPEA